MIGHTLFPLSLFRAQSKAKQRIDLLPSEQQAGHGSTRGEMPHQNPEYQHTRQHEASGQSGKQSQVRVKLINEASQPCI
jgi:hypothetical protein